MRGGDEVKEQVCSSQQGLEHKKRSSWSVFDTESLLQVVLSREMWNGAAGHWLDQAGFARRHVLRKLLWGLSPGPIRNKALSPSENLLKSAFYSLDLEICAELVWGYCYAICCTVSVCCCVHRGSGTTS